MGWMYWAPERNSSSRGHYSSLLFYSEFYKQISFIFRVNFRIGLTKAPHHSPKQNENQNCCYFIWDRKANVLIWDIVTWLIYHWFPLLFHPYFLKSFSIYTSSLLTYYLSPRYSKRYKVESYSTFKLSVIS